MIIYIKSTAAWQFHANCLMCYSKESYYTFLINHMQTTEKPLNKRWTEKCPGQCSSGSWGTVPYTGRSKVQFLVRAYAQLVGWVLSQVHIKGNRLIPLSLTSMFLSLSLKPVSMSLGEDIKKRWTEKLHRIYSVCGTESTF